MVWTNPISSDEATTTELATPSYDGIKFTTVVTADDGAKTLGCGTAALTDLLPTDQTTTSMQTQNAASTGWVDDSPADPCVTRWTYDAGEGIVAM